MLQKRKHHIHGHKRIFVSAVALFLCIASLLSVAFAAEGYIIQDAISGYPARPSAGSSGKTPSAYWMDTYLVGYRFSCWRGGDGSLTPAQLQNTSALGTQLGWSINIMINTKETWYAQKKSIMYTNDSKTQFLDKISAGQTEALAGLEDPNKTMHSIKTDLIYLDYLGKMNGKLEASAAKGSASFTFTEDLQNKIEPTNEQPLIKTVKGTTIYSGFSHIGGDNESLHTYIYGRRYSNRTSANGGGSEDMSYVPTIEDVDFHVINGRTIAFNENPSNVIDANNPNSWIAHNAPLVATLCGLTPKYGELAQNANEFGLFDYIIVEPIFFYVHANKHHMCTATDIAYMHAESMSAALWTSTNQTVDCWNKVHNKPYSWRAQGLQPSQLATHTYCTKSYFGLDGVRNAQTNPTTGAFQKNALLSGYGVYTGNGKTGSRINMKNWPEETIGYICQQRGTNGHTCSSLCERVPTYSMVFITGKSNYTVYTANGGYWWESPKGTAPINGTYTPPRAVVESLIGAGIFMAGETSKQGVIVYHENAMNGQSYETEKEIRIPFLLDENKINLLSYESANFTSLDGKFSTNIWTTARNADNTKMSALNGTAYTANQSFDMSVEIWFKSHEETRYTPNGTPELHLYANWTTQSLMTTLNRTSVASQQAAVNFAYDTTEDYADFSIAAMQVVKGDMKIIPFTRSGATWLPQEPLNSTVSATLLYSFDKSDMTAQEWTDAIYGNSDVHYQQYATLWNAQTPFFVFDFYTLEVQADGECPIQLNVQYTHNPSITYPYNTATLSSIGLADVKLPRGVQVSIDVQTSNNMSFPSPCGTLNTYAIQSNDGAIASTAEQTKLTAATNTSFRENTQMNGKKVYVLRPTSNTKLQIIPTLDGDKTLPFETYHIVVRNNTTQTEVMYATNTDLYEGALSTDANGVVEFYAAQGTKYTLYIMPAESITTNGYQFQEVTVMSGDLSDTQTIYIDYYTNQFDIQNTNAPADHSGSTLSAQIYYWTDNMLGGTYMPGAEIASTKDGAVTDFCNTCSKGAQCTRLQFVARQGVEVEVTRITPNSWYLTNTDSITTEDASHLNFLPGIFSFMDPTTPYIESFEPDIDEFNANTSMAYVGRYDVFDATKFTFKLAPYRYISATLDGENIDMRDVIGSDSAPSTVPASSFENDYKTLRVPATADNIEIAHIVSLIDGRVSRDTMSTMKLPGTSLPEETTLEFHSVSTHTDDCFTTHGVVYDGKHFGTEVAILGEHQSTHKYFTCYGGFQESNQSFIFAKCSACNQTFETWADQTLCLACYSQSAVPLTYNATAALKTDSVFSNVKASTDILRGEPIQTDNVITQAFSNVAEKTQIHFIGDLPLEDVKITFRINDVPYDSLPYTVDNLVSLGTYDLAFNTLQSGNTIHSVTATGTVTVGTHKLYLGGIETNRAITVTEGGANEFVVDFYTLRVAAGTGINNVSVTPAITKGWNGTLSYFRQYNGAMQHSSKILAVMSGDATPIHLNITASPSRSYQFNQWTQKFPAENSGVVYADDSSAQNQSAVLNVQNINAPTVIQAEAAGHVDTIVPSPFPEHSMRYYSAEIISYVDGRIKSPWTNAAVNAEVTTHTLENTGRDTLERFTMQLTNGHAIWSAALRALPGVKDPYSGYSFYLEAAPAEHFIDTSADELTLLSRYVDGGMLLANQTVRVELKYFSNHIQTQLNDVNIRPWDNIKLQTYLTHNSVTSPTQEILLDVTGRTSIVAMSGISLYISTPANSKSTTYSQYSNLSTAASERTIFIPFYTLTIETKCKDTCITCPKLMFSGVEFENNTSMVVRKSTGQHTLTFTDTDSHDVGHNAHTYLTMTSEAISKYELSYRNVVNERPYPVIVQTNETRGSLSEIYQPEYSSQQKKYIGHVRVLDTTHLILHFNCDTSTPMYTLTLKSDPAYVCTMCGQTSSKYTYCTGDDTTSHDSVYMTALFSLSQNGNIGAPNNVTGSYMQDTMVPVSATLNPINLHQTKTITVNITKDGVMEPAYEHAVYYATHDSYQDILNHIQAAKYAPEGYTTYLQEHGIIKFSWRTNGYTGAIPYSEQPYHLYIDGVKQQSAYDVYNTYTTQYKIGITDENGVIWKDADGAEINTASFIAKMDTDKTYTVYAHPVSAGVLPDNVVVNLATVSINVNTDYVTGAPWKDGESTYIIYNQQMYTIPTNGTITFAMTMDTPTTILAQTQKGSEYVDCVVFNGTITAPQIITLDYYSVTVKNNADHDYRHPVYLDGSPISQKFYLGKYTLAAPEKNEDGTYAQDSNGKLLYTTYQTEFPTKIANPTFSMNSIPSNIRLHNNTISVESQITKPYSDFSKTSALTLIAREANYSGYTALRNFEDLVPGVTYYAYLIPAYAASSVQCDAIAQINDSYVVCFAQTPTLMSDSGTLYAKDALTTTHNKIDIFVNPNATQQIKFASSLGTKYTSNNSTTQFWFNGILDGIYDIYIGNIPLIMNATDFVSTTNSSNTSIVIHNDEGKRPAISIVGETVIQQDACDFMHWIVDTHTAADAYTTTLNYEAAPSLLVTGKIICVLECSDTTSSINAASVQLKPIQPYYVECQIDAGSQYMSDKVSNPVRFNGVMLGFENYTGIWCYSISEPIVEMRTSSHTDYDIVYDARNSSCAILFENGYRFTARYHTIQFSLSYLDGDKVHESGSNGRYRDIIAIPECEEFNEQIAVTYVARYTRPEQHGTQLHIGGHVRDVKSNHATYKGWERLNPYADGSNTDPPYLEAPILKRQLFMPTYEEPGVVVSLENQSQLYSGYNFVQRGSSGIALSAAQTYGLTYAQITDTDGKSLAYASMGCRCIYDPRHAHVNLYDDGACVCPIEGCTSESRKASTVIPNNSSVYLYAHDAAPYFTQRDTTQVKEVNLKLKNLNAGQTYTVEVRGAMTSSQTICPTASTHTVTFYDLTPGAYSIYIDGVAYSGTHVGANAPYITDNCPFDHSSSAWNSWSAFTSALYIPVDMDVHWVSGVEWSRVIDGAAFSLTDEVAVLKFQCGNENCAAYGKSVHVNGNTFEHAFCNTCGAQMRFVSYGVYAEGIEEYRDYVVKENISTGRMNTVNAIDLEITVGREYVFYSVVDGVIRQPFEGAKVTIEYSTHNSAGINIFRVAGQVTATFNEHGVAYVYIPQSARFYRVINSKTVGASQNFANVNALANSGISLSPDEYQKPSVYYNVQNPSVPFYALYHTVQATAGDNIENVFADNVMSTPQGWYLNNTVYGVYQYNTVATLTAERTTNTWATLEISTTLDGITGYLGDATQLFVYDMYGWQVGFNYDTTRQVYYLTNIQVSVDTPLEIYYTSPDGIKSTGVFIDTASLGNNDAITWVGDHSLPTPGGQVSVVAPSLRFNVQHATTETAIANTATPLTASLEFFTLSLSGDSGIQSVSGSGVYHKGAEVNIGAVIKNPVADAASDYFTVNLVLDGHPYTGQQVTMWDRNKYGSTITTSTVFITLTETSTPGVYRTTERIPTGLYGICVNNTLTTVTMVAIEADNTYNTMWGTTINRNYYWNSWANTDATCTKCGLCANCHTSCQPSTHCTNYSDQRGEIALTTGCQHNWTNTQQKYTLLFDTSDVNTVVINGTTNLKATTTYMDDSHNEATLRFYITRIDLTPGIEKIQFYANAGTEQLLHEENIPWNRQETISRSYILPYETTVKTVKHEGQFEMLNTPTSVTVGIYINGQGIKYAYNSGDETDRVKIGKTLETAVNTYMDSHNYDYMPKYYPVYYTTVSSDFLTGETYNVYIDGRLAGQVTPMMYGQYLWEYYYGDHTYKDAEKHECPIHGTREDLDYSCSCMNNQHSIYHVEHGLDIFRNNIRDFKHVATDVELVTTRDITELNLTSLSIHASFISSSIGMYEFSLDVPVYIHNRTTNEHIYTMVNTSTELYFQAGHEIDIYILADVPGTVQNQYQFIPETAWDRVDITSLSYVKYASLVLPESGKHYNLIYRDVTVKNFLDYSLANVPFDGAILVNSKPIPTHLSTYTAIFATPDEYDDTVCYTQATVTVEARAHEMGSEYHSIITDSVLNITQGYNRGVVEVKYFTLYYTHRGGFTSIYMTDNYGNRYEVQTEAGAHGTASMSMPILSHYDVQIALGYTLGANNEFAGWFTNSWSSSVYEFSSEDFTTPFSVYGQYEIIANAYTYYTVREYLQDKNSNSFELVNEQRKPILINNSNWTVEYVYPGQYSNFTGVKTECYLQPGSSVVEVENWVSLFGKEVQVIIDDQQVGGQSYVNYYYVRRGSTDNKVTINYVLGDGSYNGQTGTISRTHLAGTNIKLLSPTAPNGRKFLGWFVAVGNENGNTILIGMAGMGNSNFLLCKDITVYAVYETAPDVGITANDIYGTIRKDSKFTTSATVLNHSNNNILGTISATITIYKNSRAWKTYTIDNIVVPAGGTQLIWAQVDTTGWDANATYKIAWSLNESDSNTANNTSELTSFNIGATFVGNTTRPEYSLNAPSWFKANQTTPGTYAIQHEWEYWVYDATNGFQKVTSGTNGIKANILLTPENESGLRTPQYNSTYRFYNYTTRSGYGLSLHRGHDGQYSMLRLPNSSDVIGTPYAIMSFPEFNYSTQTGTPVAGQQPFVALEMEYIMIMDAYFLSFPEYSDYSSNDANDRKAHYTPMWLPDGHYKPVTQIGGMWSPIGELTTVVTQGQCNVNAGLYSNEIVIKGSLYDDLYPNT